MGRKSLGCLDNNAMHAKSGLRVFLKWQIYRPHSVIADVIHLFHLPMTPVDLPAVGILEPQFLESGELLCFTRRIELRKCTPELIVYPSDDGVLSSKSLQKLSSRYFQFSESVDNSLKALPKLLRAECRNYEIDINHISNSELIDELTWVNIKLDPSGTVECYAKHDGVTTNFDIAIGFNKRLKLYNLHFDG